MFEHNTYERLMEDVLNDAPEGIDTRQGSIFFDAVSAVVSKIAKLYTDLDDILFLMSINTVSESYLDLRAREFSITRHLATPARYKFVHTGTTPEVGARFFHDSGYYFTLQKADDGMLYLEAEEPGTECNDIQQGDVAVPMISVTGMTSASFGETYEPGTDPETDDNLRERVLEKLAAPSENGNVAHYKTWCESITGVGQARITPLWNGENTVKAILISPLGLPVSLEVEKAVQRYVDPNDLGKTVVVNGRTYNVGDGLGNGVANIGAHFTAAAANTKTINVTFKAELAVGSDMEKVKESAKTALEAYFRDLVLNASDDSNIVVRTSAIGAILAGLSTVMVDYLELKINDGTGNLTITEDEVPVVGEVMVSVVS